MQPPPDSATSAPDPVIPQQAPLDGAVLVVIVLATHNGETHLRQQLESIAAQTYPNWHLLARDDVSSDGSCAILNEFQRELAGRVTILSAPDLNRGPLRNFFYLIEAALAAERPWSRQRFCIALCDQDDHWRPDRLARGVEALFTQPDREPCLVHSDLAVIANDGAVIAKRFTAYQGLNPRHNRFADLLLTNIVTGCTITLNTELARKVVPIPEHAVMHDWWIALVAALTGRIVFVDAPLVGYRQHGRNTLGAREDLRRSVINRIRALTSPRNDQAFRAVARQAARIADSRPRGLTLRGRFAAWVASTLLRPSSRCLRLLGIVGLRLLAGRRPVRRRAAAS